MKGTNVMEVSTKKLVENIKGIRSNSDETHTTFIV